MLQKIKALELKIILIFKKNYTIRIFSKQSLA